MTVLLKRFSSFAYIFPVIFFFLLFCAAHANASQIEIVYPPSAGEAVKLSVKDFAGYLKKMGEKDVSEIQAEKWSAGKEDAGKIVFLIQHPDGKKIIGLKNINQVGYDGFAIAEKKTGSTRVIATWGDEPRGAQYAVYDMLQTLGVRFFHPEQEYIPPAPAFPENFTKVENPSFKYRGFSLHTTHPVELINSFANCKENIMPAKRWIDWIIKNKSNMATTGARGGWVAQDCYKKRSSEIYAYADTRGFLKSSGIGFGNYQQGGSFKDVDPKTGLPTKEDVLKDLEARLGDKTKKFDLFGVHFGTSEYTTTDDIATVELFNVIARWMAENRPDIPVFINSHTSGGQTTPHYKVEYYDLPQFAPTTLGIQVHTMFFYDLIGPAPYYGNKDVRYKYEMMLREAQKGRALMYYPESAWWLSFDNSIPLYLPVTLKTRDNDMQLIKPLIAKTLQGHKLFTTGQEWGYWQIDWCVAQMQWNAEVRYTDCLRDITTPLGEKTAQTVADTVKEIALSQEQVFIYHDRIKYLAGEDEIDEVGALAGIVSYPMRVPFVKIKRWSKQQIKLFREQELAPLRAMGEKYADWLVRLEKVKNDIPKNTRWVYDEIYDGTEIMLLRVQHSAALYEAVLAWRENVLDKKTDNKNVQEFFKKALATTDKAKKVIARREKQYRYPLAWSTGGGVTPETAVDNGTVYGYRVHTKTHLAFYWTRRNEQVKAILSGAQEIIPVSPLFPLSGELVSVNVKNIKGKNIFVQVESEPPSDKKEFTFKPEGATVVALKGEEMTPLQWTVVPVQKLFSITPDGITVTKPVNPMVSQTVGKVFPVLLAGISADGKELVLSLDADENGDADSTEFSRFENAKQTVDGWEAEPASFAIYLTNPATGEKISAIHLVDFTMRVKNVTEEGADIFLSGGLDTNDVVNAIMQLGGMDEKGTRGLIANLLHVPSEQLPAAISFEAKCVAKAVTTH